MQPLSLPVSGAEKHTLLHYVQHTAVQLLDIGLCSGASVLEKVVQLPGDASVSVFLLFVILPFFAFC